MQEAKIPKEKQLEQLQSFLDSHPSPSEMKRALAVKLALEGYGEHHISEILNFSSWSIHKWKQTFQKKGIDGLLTDYKQPQKLNKQAALEEINRIIIQGDWDILSLEIDLIKKTKNNPEIVSYSLEIDSNKEDDSQRADLKVSTSDNEHPWMPFAGMYADNPLVDEVQGFIESDRLKLDEEMSENDLHIASEE